VPIAALLLGLSLSGPCFSGPSAEDVQRAVNQVFEGRRYQRRWPRAEDAWAEGAREGGAGDRTVRPLREAEGRTPVTRSRRRGDRPFDPPSRVPRDPSAPDGSDVARGAMIVLIVGALLLAAVWVARRLRPPAVDVRASAAPATPAIALPPAPPTLDEVERLAAEGRYAEAVHLLLLRAVAALGSRVPLPPSLTSREVVKASGLEGAPGDALERLVRVVERSRFGGRPVDRLDFEGAREHAERLREGKAVA
jgi:hypothetical protein